MAYVSKPKGVGFLALLVNLTSILVNSPYAFLSLPRFFSSLKSSPFIFWDNSNRYATRWLSSPNSRPYTFSIHIFATLFGL
ncbi:MAG: hypothetical protein LBG05_00155 [Treponema sp.]|nr:hypothetical protein [Treponema sp.]